MLKKDIENNINDIKLRTVESEPIFIDMEPSMIPNSQTEDENSESQNNTKPCPFCGGEVTVIITDEEGNFRDEEYAKDPWSGLSFALNHDNEANPNCPVSNHVGEILGSFLYDTEEDALSTWNIRNK